MAHPAFGHLYSSVILSSLVFSCFLCFLMEMKVPFVFVFCWPEKLFETFVFEIYPIVGWIYFYQDILISFAKNTAYYTWDDTVTCFCANNLVLCLKFKDNVTDAQQTFSKWLNGHSCFCFCFVFVFFFLLYRSIKLCRHVYLFLLTWNNRFYVPNNQLKIMWLTMLFTIVKIEELKL